MTASESAGSKKDGQPQWDSNFSVLRKISAPQARHCVDAFGLGVGVLTDERALGAGLAQHGELLRRELLAPFVVGQLNLRELESVMPPR